MSANSIIHKFAAMCRAAGITHVTGVPDGYLAPLIQAVTNDKTLTYIPAAREEECLGIAAGLSMAGKNALVMMQNVGFLNSIGCYSTLCTNYRTSFVILIAQRGNIFDRNTYDIPKLRHWNNIATGMNMLTTSWYAYRDEQNVLSHVAEQSRAAGEPAFLLLDFPPTREVAC